MTRRRNKTPILNKPVSLDDEINVKDFPYYPYIPIKTISDKQRKPMQRYKIIQRVEEPNIKTETTTLILPPTQKYVESEDKINILDTVPQYKYETEMQEMEKRLSDINEEIQQNLQKLYQHQQTINANEHYIQEQTLIIDKNRKVIDTNNEYINQQILSYNHNANILTTQYNQVNGFNGEVNRLSQILGELQGQITDAQSELQDLNTQIDDAKNQMGYHGIMLSAFNIMMQNPQYFMQMLATASGYLNQNYTQDSQYTV